MKESTLIKFGNQFKAEMAARYNLPELNGAGFETSKVDGDFVMVKTGDIEVAPTGQMAGLVKQMTVRVELGASGKHVRGAIHYRYQHHGGGSNGNEHVFVIVTESRYGEPEYAGAISERVAYALQNQLSPAA